LKTGDIAIARDGEFWIVDRKKVRLERRRSTNTSNTSQELIKVNGLQVSPSELEAVLGKNSSVVDAAVVGVTT
jgi:Acyl-CoA synthetases (AMP-forming)/AMP-acid ligases II